MMAQPFSKASWNQLRTSDPANRDQRLTLGPGPVKALEKFLEIAKRDGYETTGVVNYAGRHLRDKGRSSVSLPMDVVPAGSSWNTDPYKPEIIDGKLYARGSSDDKGSQ